MVRFLTAEWVRALDDAARQHVSDGGRAGDTATLVLEQQVTNTDGPPTHSESVEFVFQIVCERGAVRVVADGDRPPTLTLVTDRDTAVGIARGTSSAQEAFLQGRLRVCGDVQSLVDHADLMKVMDGAFSAVRGETEY
jgi:SCP-2 sterol transfer family